MEHERLVNEKQSIRDSARQLKKYGSTCNHVRNTEQLIRHELQKTDTLQGIALKYGCTVRKLPTSTYWLIFIGQQIGVVSIRERAKKNFPVDGLSQFIINRLVYFFCYLLNECNRSVDSQLKSTRYMRLEPHGVIIVCFFFLLSLLFLFNVNCPHTQQTEQIRRTNRLFAQDSLFLRQYLMIPIDRDSEHYNSKAERPHSLPPRAATIDASSYDTNRPATTPKATSPIDAYLDALSPEEESRKSMDEFLEKIDSTLAKTRTFVAKSQKNTYVIQVTVKTDQLLFNILFLLHFQTGHRLLWQLGCRHIIVHLTQSRL